MEASDKLLISKINDLFRLCEKHSCAKFSPFLDGGQIAVIQDNIVFPYGYNTMFFGGFEVAECKMLGVFPECEEPLGEEFPIKALKMPDKDHRTREAARPIFVPNLSIIQPTMRVKPE